ncbi:MULTISPECIES: MerR family transcriptional regulator [Terrabacteria group]|uniref:MerR family transcriptional regulator n=1 Tax=Bacillati TaxID=1783272 RepID=UPI00193A9687|nr:MULTISPECIES: MerR family transcriptional regulator [Terrabacteria group]MBW9212011.1 MerR family transcriptional regulator [Trueperella sp. zg.1013]QRG87182.1 MerR family transcriptional regulator [Bulleidia sp. zg-1006]
MLRNKIQKKTGLTRKTIKCYEEKGLIQPLKLENGYRDYRDEDLVTPNIISLFRKVGLSISEIEKCLSSNGNSLSSLLRKKQNIIDDKIALIEAEESIYEKLENAFPGYFGQLIFSAY